MPGNHSEILLDEQNEDDNKNKKTRKKKKKKIKDVKVENKNRLELPLISKTRKRFLSKIRNKPKSPNRCSSPSCSESRIRGCFCVMIHRRTEEEEDQCSSSSPLSDPNDENFTPEMMRVMLESNDFLSTDCNPHR